MGTLINLDQNLDQNLDLIKMKMVGEDEAGPLKEDQEMMELEDEVEEGLRQHGDAQPGVHSHLTLSPPRAGYANTPQSTKGGTGL